MTDRFGTDEYKGLTSTAVAPAPGKPPGILDRLHQLRSTLGDLEQKVADLHETINPVIEPALKIQYRAEAATAAHGGAAPSVEPLVMQEVCESLNRVERLVGYVAQLRMECKL